MLVGRAFRTNETFVREEAVRQFLDAEGLELDPAVRPILLRYALRSLAEAQMESARRKLGVYPSPDEVPVLPLSITSRGVAQSANPMQVPRPTEYAALEEAPGAAQSNAPTEIPGTPHRGSTEPRDRTESSPRLDV